MSKIEELRNKIRQSINPNNEMPGFLEIPTLEETRKIILEYFEVNDYDLKEEIGLSEKRIRYFEFRLKTPEISIDTSKNSFIAPKFILKLYENSSQIVLQTIDDVTIYHRVFSFNSHLRKEKFLPIKEEMMKYFPLHSPIDNTGNLTHLMEKDLELERVQNAHF